MVRAEPGPATNWSLVIAAFAVLVSGTLVYVLDRPADSNPFFSAISVEGLFPSPFGRIGEHLPTFSHVFALSLLTAACFGGGSRAGLWACLTWLGIDAAFEVGQHPEIAEHIVPIIPGKFESMPVLGYAKSYFLSGTFDVWDVLSIVVGAIAAFILTAVIRQRNIYHG
jgi:hypothetical protein